MSLYGIEWRERGYGLTEKLVNKCDVLMPQHFIKPRLIDRRHNLILIILIGSRWLYLSVYTGAMCAGLFPFDYLFDVLTVFCEISWKSEVIVSLSSYVNGVGLILIPMSLTFRLAVVPYCCLLSLLILASLIAVVIWYCLLSRLILVSLLAVVFCYCLLSLLILASFLAVVFCYCCCPCCYYHPGLLLFPAVACCPWCCQVPACWYSLL